MSIDFTNEEEQREVVPGPVPGGSIVVLAMHILEPRLEQQARDNKNIFVSKNGLRQIYCQFVVDRGTYAGVQFRQNITLPIGQQNINLTAGQRTACNIGGAQLKAMCEAANRSLKMRDITEMEGIKFPARLGINDKPTVKDDGRVYWNNRILFIITKGKEEYDQVRQYGEIIMESGPVTGKGAAIAASDSSYSQADARDDAVWDNIPQNGGSENLDDMPF